MFSLLLITKNESANLEKWATWLPQLKNLSQIAVIDSGSTDSTLSIIKKWKNTRLSVDIETAFNPDNFSSLRSQCLKLCKNEWVLWLDPDETPSPGLIEFLNTFTPSGTAFSFPRHDFFLNKELRYGESSSQHFIRLFNKKHGQFVGAVHEVWQTTQSITKTNFHIIHHPHSTLKGFMEKINRYSQIRATELKEQGIRSSVLSIILYPLAKFFVDYFVLLGLLDGTPGIIQAIGMSFHSFLVRAKLWHLWQIS